jgi:hypothetical protein
MICETCRWTSRLGFIPARPSGQSDTQCDMIPCPDCGGQGIAHCCDGICEQSTVHPLTEIAKSPARNHMPPSPPQRPDPDP